MEELKNIQQVLMHTKGSSRADIERTASIKKMTTSDVEKVVSFTDTPDHTALARAPFVRTSEQVLFCRTGEAPKEPQLGIVYISPLFPEDTNDDYT